MKCEKCVAEGKTSRLNIEKGEMTDATHPPTFYDEEGVIHIHREKSGKRARIHCTEGHKGWLIGETRCISCEFGKPETVVWDD